MEIEDYLPDFFGLLFTTYEVLLNLKEERGRRDSNLRRERPIETLGRIIRVHRWRGHRRAPTGGIITFWRA